jgi:hypothetical protein
VACSQPHDKGLREPRERHYPHTRWTKITNPRDPARQPSGLSTPLDRTAGAGQSRNKAFIDEAIERGDELRLVTNPNEPLYQGGNVYQREISLPT